MKMKPSRRFKSSVLLAGALWCAASLVTAQAASTLVTFSVDMATNILNGSFIPASDHVSARGSFNGYSELQLAQQGSSTVYTNTANDTTDANGTTLQYKFYSSNGSTWESLATGQNRAALLPTNSGASLVLPTPFFNDGGAAVANNITFQVDVAQQIALGNFDPATTDQVVVRGIFNGWSGNATALTLDTSIHRTNQFGLVTTNVYTGTHPVTSSPAAMQAFKYVIARTGGDQWDSPSSANQDGGGNRYFANVAQALPLVNFSDAPFAPLAKVTFSVDMSAVLISDAGYDPATVTVNGDFNGWSSGIACTNNPIAANTNIYTSTAITAGAGSTINYQFRYVSSGNTVYDNAPGGGNRQFVVPNVTSTNVPPVFFKNVLLSDLLNVDTTVLFSVNMTNAVGNEQPGHVFDSANDLVYINGDFSGWVAWNPISLAGAGLTCTNNPPGSLVYSYEKTFLKGQSRSVTYKYSINGADDEAGFGQNHGRYIRSTNGVYAMPLDTFGAMYVEPKFGNLAIGRVSGGSFPITWLGYPNVNLQKRSSLTSGVWQDVAGTTAGSSTNWPNSGGTQFFRLIQP